MKTGLSREQLGMILSLLLSVGAHVGVLLWIGLRTQTPELGIDFELPAEVEFGLTEEMTVEPGPRAGAPPEQPADEAPEPAETGEGDRTVDAGAAAPDAGVHDAGVRDAGPGDAGVDAGPELVAEADTQTEGGSEEGEGAGAAATDTGEGSTTMPPGAQLAIRLDMARIRTSRLSESVGNLLAAIPDWQIVLAGSDIDPLSDLDRLLIASPNLRRDRMLLAGRHQGDQEYVRGVVSRMASARGVAAPWRTSEGVPVAPWPDADDTERVVALTGPQHFTITRPEDLPRLLAVARVRAEEEGSGDEDDPQGAEALLSMDEGAAITFEVEGARRFARGVSVEAVPTRARFAVRELPGGRVGLTARGTYDSAEQAEAARDFWDRYRNEYIDSLGSLQRLFMESPLRGLELRVEGEEVHARGRLSQTQTQMALGYLQGLLEARARRRAREREAGPSME